MTASDAGHEHDEVTPDPGAATSGAGPTGDKATPAGDKTAPAGEQTPTIVVRDRRRVDQSGNRQAAAGTAEPAAKAAAGEPADKETPAAADTVAAEETVVAEGDAAAGDQDAKTVDESNAQSAEESKEESGVGTGETTIDLEVTEAAEAARGAAADGDAGDGQIDTELARLRRDIGELTRDLQRVTAEYANYRKRVDRDRTLAAEQATGVVLGALIPVLDDLDRARAHGDLVGPFAAVAEQLSAALGKFGLTAFGETGDPFDPTLHEAVSHTSSPDVTQTTCVEVMRRGYLLGDRLLRPALVAVADPE